MKRLGLSLLLAVFVGLPLMAQGTAAPAALDPDLLSLMKLNMAQSDQTVADKYALLSVLPQFKAYEQAVQQAEGVKASIQKIASARAPGYTLDLKTWAWKKIP